MLLAELRFALRNLLRRPFLAAAAILTIGLALGANTAVFNVVYAVLLDPLPFREPERVMQVWETHPEFATLQVSAAAYADWRGTVRSFEPLSAYTFQAMNRGTLIGQGEPEAVQMTQVTHDLLPMLGVKPLQGRFFTEGEERGKRKLAMISESLWKRKFSADPAAVGRTLRLDGESFEIVGVIPQKQAFPPWADLWTPLSLLDPAVQNVRRFHPLEVVGRLKPGVSVQAAQAEMQVVAAQLAKRFPETNGTEGALVIPLAGQLTNTVRPVLLLIWGAVGLVLLIACANVAHFILVRTFDRGREFGVRAALGATRWQVLRPLMLESAIVALAGAMIGLELSLLATPVLDSLAHGRIPRFDGSASSPIGAFAFAASLVCALLCAIPAVRQASRFDITALIARGVTPGVERSRFGRMLIGAEAALAFIVLTGALLLVRSFSLLIHEEPGFRTAGVTAVDVSMGADWDQAERVFETQLAPRLRAIPGVQAVAAANTAPMRLGPMEKSRFATRFGVVGQQFEAGHFPVAQLRWITPDYFDVLGISLTQGRLFTGADKGKQGYVINETLARRFFPGQDPVGKQLLSGVASPKPQAVPIIGVVGDVRDLSLDLEVQPMLYSLGVSPGMDVLIRSTGSDREVMAVLRSALPDAPLRGLRPLDAMVSESLSRQRFALSLFGVFAAMAAALTIVGVYAVMSYSVSRRVREFGIRTAIGAAPGDLRQLVLRETLLAVVPGLAIGAALSMLFSRFLATLLYKVTPMDPLSWVSVSILLALIAVASALLPAYRAARTLPGVALRDS